ncbi:exo-beta-N-acetylmuramidase NamZ domain-containing protein [Flavobacterium qiangtangense]|uniref:Exo-beta-N-acetylmuramidase NamZ domain-containing protein n=1 Tax=Flavobacterium qiangtangense TaxID=1442595 RepID=A0ABW1PSQ7_9FLAO
MNIILKSSFALIGSLAIALSCGSSKPLKGKEISQNPIENKTAKDETIAPIKTGADNSEKYLSILKGKKVGIVTNQTGILSDKTHLVDFLLEKKVNIQKIYAPEHGFRGTADAGELIKDGKDTQTGLPIISLYGDNKKPKPEQLKEVDVLVFDLQDVGARFYTYISSLHYVMEACAENNIPLVILDRPNPNGGVVDGPILEKENTSFIGMHPIPVLHGMTIGEYGQMINGEKWLKNGIQCQLTVIPCLNYNKEMNYSLPVKPSPNLPNDQSINLYASLCFFEGTNVSLGRGTEKQFQIYGSPFLPKSGFSFTPKPNFGAKDPLHNGKLCYGEDLSGISKISGLQLKWLLKAYNSTSDKSKFFIPFFTKLAGTKKLQEQIEAGLTEPEIKKTWQVGLENFKKIRKNYQIY